ncbi:hypothetical protein L535_1611 [Bordetella bronchiseptica SBL-F6116]|nr:hypothetical protein L535_1611 [Bordetella bronchiseptica SBL-F6116]
MVPPHGASTGISIFMDSRMAISWSSATVSPAATSTFHTEPLTSEITSTLAMMCSTLDKVGTGAPAAQ